MKEDDIRIGNSLLPYGEVVKVTEIGFRIYDYYLRVEGSKNGYYLDQFEPIKLTEEILLKCGFEKELDDNDNIDYTLSNLEFWIQYHKEVDNFIFFGGGNSLGIKTNHLHQLQNLFFVLNGKELEINGL